MRVLFSAVADAANRSDNGKLNLLGVFQNIYAVSVPCQHPWLCVVIAVEASPLEKGTTQTISLKLIDYDGYVVMELPDSAISITESPADLNPVSYLIINIGGVVFAKFGEYRFDIACDHISISQVPIRIVRVIG